MRSRRLARMPFVSSMQLSEFTNLVPNFQALSQIDQIIHFGWYLHHHQKKENFGQGEIRECFKEANMVVPNTSLIFKRLVERRPRIVIQSAKGIKLEAKVRGDLDKKFGEHESTIAVSKMLSDLVGKLSDEAERHFLSEAIKCYKARAPRAAIIMAWNLTYDHLLKWIMADSRRMADFNASIRIVFPRLASITVTKREHFEEFKEAQVLDICGNAGLFSGNTKKVLKIQLDKRNLAAHPSMVEIQPPQADDTISSLVNNVVLILK
jgi:hypothetical protein